MTTALDTFNTLTQAEEYFEFLEVPYDPQVVRVNRLHILKKFSQLIRETEPGLDPDATLAQYRQALQTAYSLFLRSTPVQEKLFKVFQDRPQNVVMLSDIGME